MRTRLAVTIMSAALVAGTVPANAETNLRDQKKNFAEEQRDGNKAWREDFKARQKQAFEQYKQQGLTPEQIREKMAPFRAEAKAHREENLAEYKEFKDDLKAQRKAKKEAMIDKLDANDDGRIGPGERRGGPGAGPDRKKKHFDNGVRDHGKGQGRDGRGQGGEHRRKK